jgi:hypothetical protein
MPLLKKAERTPHVLPAFLRNHESGRSQQKLPLMQVVLVTPKCFIAFNSPSPLAFVQELTRPTWPVKEKVKLVSISRGEPAGFTPRQLPSPAGLPQSGLFFRLPCPKK